MKGYYCSRAADSAQCGRAATADDYYVFSIRIAIVRPIMWEAESSTSPKWWRTRYMNEMNFEREFLSDQFE